MAQAITNWDVWWRLLRPHTLTAAFVPVAVGTALAANSTAINWPLFLAMLLASLLIQSATNMFNEYYDYVRGLDTAESVGIGGTIVRDGVSAKTVLFIALSFYAAALVFGIYICSQSSWWLAAVGLVCMAAGYLYTGGPCPIAATPFGELASGFFMGLLIIVISFFIQTGTVTTTSVLAAVPVWVLIGAILMANNIRDHDGDKANGRRTLAILLGRPKAINFLAGMFIFAYSWLICLVVLKVFAPPLLLALISAPKAYQAYRGFVGKTKAVQMMPAMKATAQTNTLFGLMMAVGLVLTAL